MLQGLSHLTKSPCSLRFLIKGMSPCHVLGGIVFDGEMY